MRLGTGWLQTGLIYLAERLPALAAASLEAWCHAGELEALSQYRFPKRRLSYLTGRYAAKQALKLFVKRDKLALSSVRIQNAPAGFPCLCMPGRDIPEITIAHSGHAAVAAVYSPAFLRLGVDLERIDPAHAGTLRQACRDWQPELAGRGLDFLTRWWTQREALGKGLRCGLRIHPSQLEVLEISRQKGHVSARYPRQRVWQAYSWRWQECWLSLAWQPVQFVAEPAASWNGYAMHAEKFLRNPLRS
jgi:phosphopantetheinyl transferase